MYSNTYPIQDFILHSAAQIIQTLALTEKKYLLCYTESANKTKKCYPARLHFYLEITIAIQESIFPNLQLKKYTVRYIYLSIK